MSPFFFASCHFSSISFKKPIVFALLAWFKICSPWKLTMATNGALGSPRTPPSLGRQLVLPMSPLAMVVLAPLQPFHRTAQCGLCHMRLSVSFQQDQGSRKFHYAEAGHTPPKRTQTLDRATPKLLAVCFVTFFFLCNLCGWARPSFVILP